LEVHVGRSRRFDVLEVVDEGLYCDVDEHVSWEPYLSVIDRFASELGCGTRV
jgi:hypothetical protein